MSGKKLKGVNHNNMAKTKLMAIRERVASPFLNYYTLEYENKAGKRKNYEMVSKQKIGSPEELSGRTNGVVMIVFVEGKLLLVREFRMAVNQFVYNLPAGSLEEGESIEECAKRELFEETGLGLLRIRKILPPSYGAVDLTNAKAAVVLLEAEGELSDAHLTEDEEIIPMLLSKEQTKELLFTQPFSARAQMAAWMFLEMESYLNSTIVTPASPSPNTPRR